jgi:hypothetical protein
MRSWICLPYSPLSFVFLHYHRSTILIPSTASHTNHQLLTLQAYALSSTNNIHYSHRSSIAKSTIICPVSFNDLPSPSNTIANFQANHFTACSLLTTSLLSPCSLPITNPYSTLSETGCMGGSFPSCRRRIHGITSIPSPPTTHTRSIQLLLFAILTSSRSIPRGQPPHQHTYQTHTTIVSFSFLTSFSCDGCGVYVV